jgi:hypothetical protein
MNLAPGLRPGAELPAFHHPAAQRAADRLAELQATHRRAADELEALKAQRPAAEAADLEAEATAVRTKKRAPAAPATAKLDEEIKAAARRHAVMGRAVEQQAAELISIVTEHQAALLDDHAARLASVGEAYTTALDGLMAAAAELDAERARGRFLQAFPSVRYRPVASRVEALRSPAGEALRITEVLEDLRETGPSDAAR